MDDHRAVETRTTFDTQSDNTFKDWTGNPANEYGNTEPFGHTVPLESPSEETQVDNFDTELLDIPDSVDDMATQMLEDDKEEVVLDSDDEGVHEAETVFSKELTSGEHQRISLGDVPDAPCASSADFVVGSVASSHKHCTAVYKGRWVNSACLQTVQSPGLGRGSNKIRSIGPSSIPSDACSQKQDVIKFEAPGFQKYNLLLASEHESAELKYTENEEPADSSQANALSFVDQYLSFINVNLSEEVAPKWTSRQKSPPVLCAKGPQILARRATLGTTSGISGTFEWDANDTDGGEGDLLKDTKNLVFNGEGPEATSVTRCPTDRNLDIQNQMNRGDQSKEQFKGEMIDVYSSNSSLKVLNTDEVGDVLEASGMNFVKEMDHQLNAEASEQQLEAGGLRSPVPDMFDVGFNTQMAAEAMEALFYAPPPSSNIHSTPQDPETIVEDSSKSSTGKYSNSGVAAGKMKQKNKPSRKLSSKIIRSFRNDKRSREELDPELLEANKVKRGKLLAESPLSSGNASNVENHSSRSSFTGRDIINELDDKTRSDVMEAGILKKRKKNGGNADAFPVLSCGGKRPKIVLRTSKKAKDVEVSKNAEVEIDVGSRLMFNEWGYCKGKRTHRSLPCHSNVVKGEKGDKEFMDICKKSELDSETTCLSADSHKKSQGNSETSCFSFYVRRKRRSPGCAHRIQPSPIEKSQEKSGIPDHGPESIELDIRSSGNAGCSRFSFYVRRKRRSSGCVQPSSVEKSQKKSGIPDHGLVSSADGANESIGLDIRSSGNVGCSLPKCHSPVNFTEGMDLGPSILNGNGKGKQLLTRKRSRFPLTKEVISLGLSESLPNIRSRDLRRRRDMANVRVLFSNNLDSDIIKQQKKILVRLGSSIASCASDATHFVADKFVRTRNMLESIALGKPVVTQLWLDSCGQAGCFIDEKNYILRDVKKEKEFGFSMPVSLARARQHPLLKGLRVIVSSNVKPGKDLVMSLVKAVHGQIVDGILETSMKNKMIPKDVLILSCEQDYGQCAPFLDNGAAVYSSELLLTGIITQKLEFERHRLFKSHVNGNCSHIGLKKSGERSRPVAICQ